MSSRYQREKNRNTTARLGTAVQQMANDAHTCGNCGERGFHWEHPVGGFMGFLPTEGFWTCSKYYDPVTKRRIGT